MYNYKKEELESKIKSKRRYIENNARDYKLIDEVRLDRDVPELLEQQDRLRREAEDRMRLATEITGLIVEKVKLNEMKNREEI